MAGTWTVQGAYGTVGATATVVVEHGTATTPAIEPATATLQAGKLTQVVINSASANMEIGEIGMISSGQNLPNGSGRWCYNFGDAVPNSDEPKPKGKFATDEHGYTRIKSQAFSHQR